LLAQALMYGEAVSAYEEFNPKRRFQESGFRQEAPRGDWLFAGENHIFPALRTFQHFLLAVQNLLRRPRVLIPDVVRIFVEGNARISLHYDCAVFRQLIVAMRTIRFRTDVLVPCNLHLAPRTDLLIRL